MGKVLAQILCIAFFTIGLAQGVNSYVVKTGDTLTKISLIEIGAPIYGVEGSLQKILKLNPSLKNPNLIYPGYEIYLPVMESKIAVVPSEDPVITPPAQAEETHPLGPLSRSQVALGLGVEFFSLKGEDPQTKKSISILSGMSPAAQLQWVLQFNESLDFYLQARILKYQLQDLDDGKKFSSTSGSLISGNFGIRKITTEKLSLGAEFGIQESLFFRLKNPETVAIETVPILAPALTLKYKVDESRNAEYGLLGKLTYLVASKTSNYTIDAGQGFLLGGYINHAFLQDKSLEGTVFYSAERQDTSITERTLAQTGFQVSYRWQF